MVNLNKENFWNPLIEQYPEAVKYFCDWIDTYKEKCNWDYLFKNGKETIPNASVFSQLNVKFHNIPLEMQYGILTRFFIEEEIMLNLNWIWEYENIANEIEKAFNLLNNKIK